MRVLRIAHSSLTPALRARERALVKSYPDVDLEVLTTPSWCEAEMQVTATPDDLFRVRTAQPYLSKHIQLFAYDPAPIINALKQHRPHVIDMNHEPYSVACAEVLTLCKQYAPQAAVVMQTAQNIVKRYPLPFRWFEQRAFRRVAAAYVCSESVRQTLRVKGFRKPVALIPFGVNLESFHPREASHLESDRPLTIGFVGRMLPGKGLSVLADALISLRQESWRVLLVGDGPTRADFERRLSEAGLLDRAELVGAISYDQVPDYFKRMDVLVMPTKTTNKIREQFGRVLVEAMATGIPVIGSSSGAIPEVIGDAGLIFPEDDGQVLAGALKQLLADPRLRERLARSGRMRVEKNYSWERIAEMTHEFFRQILLARAQSISDLEIAA